MQSLLADPALCGWPPQQITVIGDPISAADLGNQIAELAEATNGVLLVYYVGHGGLSDHGEELCLTVTSTLPNRPKITGLPWEHLADVLRASPARIRLVILDCCFAGRAIESLSAEGNSGLADITHVDGVYTLTATTRNRTAHVPPPGQQDTACTSFTGELRDLIRSGIPGKPPRLTFNDLFPVLRRRLLAKGLPAPYQHGTGTVHQFLFTANPAARIGPDAHNIWSDGNGIGEAAAAATQPESVPETPAAAWPRPQQDPALATASSATADGSPVVMETAHVLANPAAPADARLDARSPQGRHAEQEQDWAATTDTGPQGGGKAAGCLLAIVGFFALLTLFSYLAGRDSGVYLMAWLLGGITVILLIIFLLGWLIRYALPG